MRRRGACPGATRLRRHSRAGRLKCGAGLSLCRGGCRRNAECVVAAGDADDRCPPQRFASAQRQRHRRCRKQGEKFCALRGFNFDKGVIDGDLGADCHAPADFCFSQAFAHVRERENLGHFTSHWGIYPIWNILCGLATAIAQHADTSGRGMPSSRHGQLPQEYRSISGHVLFLNTGPPGTACSSHPRIAEACRQKQRSAVAAASSPPLPPKVGASCAIIRQPVFCGNNAVGVQRREIGTGQ